jgi:diacylglycerol kinase (ATP)
LNFELLKKKIRFIVNPISGFGKQKIIEKLVEQNLDRMLFDYNIVYTKAAKHATDLAKQAVLENIDIVVAVGGDGSINEIGRGLIGSNTALAIVPAGSGNGLARCLNIPLDLTKAIQIINKAKEKRMDTFQFNEERVFNISGIGFDAFINEKMMSLSNRNIFAYIKLIGKEFYKYKEQNFEISIDGKTHQKKAFLICFANGPQWGHGSFIAPQADHTDGLIDIAILKDVSIFNVLNLGFKILNRSIHTSSHLEVIRTKEVSIKQISVLAQIDGETVKIGNTISIKIDPLSLKVIVP